MSRLQELKDELRAYIDRVLVHEHHPIGADELLTALQTAHPEIGTGFLNLLVQEVLARFDPIHNEWR
jgi:hypothetical protein